MAKIKVNSFSVGAVTKANVYKHRLKDANRRERGVDWRESNPNSKDFIANKPSGFLELDDMKKKVDLLSPSPSTFESATVDADNKNLAVTMSDGSVKNINVDALLDNINITSSAIDEGNKKLRITLSDGSEIETDISKLLNKDDVKLTAVDIEDASSTLSLTLSNGSKITTDISKLYNKVSNVVYDESTKILTTSFENGSTISTNLSKLSEDKYTKSVEIDTDANLLKVTMSDDSIIDVNIESLLDNVNITGSTIDDVNKKLKISLSDGSNIETDISKLYDNVNISSTTIDETAGKLISTLSDGSTIETDISNLLKDEMLKTAVVDLDSKKAKFTMSDDSIIEMDIESLLDNVNVTNGEVNLTTKKLNLTLSNGSIVEIDITSLVDDSVVSGVVDLSSQRLKLGRKISGDIEIDISALISDGIGTLNHIAKFGTDKRLTETPWMIDNSNNLVYGIANGKQAIHINRVNSGLILQDKRHTGFSNEVDGQLVNFGTNFNQLGDNTRDPNYTGAWFRVDTRTSQLGYNLLTLYHQPPNESELIVFNVGASGKLNLNGADTSIRFNNKTELSPRIDYIHLDTVASFKNGWKIYNSTIYRAKIMKTSNGIVTIEGLVTDGVNGTFICNLPTQYRPKHTVVMMSMCANSKFQRVDIYSNGDIKVVNDGIRTDTGWLSLHTSFYAGI